MDRALAAAGITVGILLGGGIVAFIAYQIWAVRSGWRGSDY